MRKPSRLALAFFAVLLFAPAALGAERHYLVACVPDAPGSTEAAAPYLARFFRAVERSLGWPEKLRGMYTASEKRCRRELRRRRTTLALLSLGLYLSLRERLRLRPLAVTESGGASSGRYHVVVRKGAVSSLEDLRGARFFTRHGADPRLLARLILGGKLGEQVAVRRTRRSLRALRAVWRGDARATILDDGELEKMKLLPFAEDLAVIYSSQPLPNPILAAVGERAGADAEALAAKLLTLCGGEAKAVCESIRVSGFAAPDAEWLESLSRRYLR
jgi:hypothetical protein